MPVNGMSEKVRNLLEKRAAYWAEMTKIMEKMDNGEMVTVADRDEYHTFDLAMKHCEAELRQNGYDPRSSGNDNLDGIGRAIGAAGPTEEDRAFTEYLRNGRAGPELRAQAEGTGTAGGYLVPQGFWDKLAVALKLYGGLSQDFETLETDTGNPMPWPTINPTTVVAAYLNENTQAGTTTYVFGQGELFAWTIVSGVIQASLQLVQDSAQDVDQFVADRVGEQLGRKIAAEALVGGGSASQQATGLRTAIASAGQGNFVLTAATSVKTFAAPAGATELVGNVLSPATCFKMIAAVDPAYWNPGDGTQCYWYMNATQALNMRQVVDANGRPLLNLEDGMSGGAIGTIGGFPVKVVNEIANLQASTLGGPIFGNMGHAMVLRMVKNANLMRLTERYADFLQVGYIGYQRFDMQPNDLRAVAMAQAVAT